MPARFKTQTKSEKKINPTIASHLSYQIVSQFQQKKNTD